MKLIMVWLLLFCLFACGTDDKPQESVQESWICKKEMSIKEEDGKMYAGNYIAGYVVMDGKLNRIVHVREYMRDSFSFVEEYEYYMTFLQNSCFLQLDDDSRRLAIMPYYETDRIVYPYSILDYTDLGKYTEIEVPTQVRTEDGKSIDFELYWEYIQQNGVLDGFVCTLEK